MISPDELNKALAAHVAWKGRIEAAIDTGTSDFSVEKVSTDNQCDFGKWLYNVAESSRDAYWQKVCAKHAQFHRITGNILNMALQGRKQEAHDAVDFGSDFMMLSSELTMMLTSWPNV